MKRKLCVLLSAACAAALAAGVLAACAPQGELTYTEGFTFERSADDSGYVVTGLGSEIEVEEDGRKIRINSNRYSAEHSENNTAYTHVSVPATYDGRPVVGIAEGALRGHEELIEVNLPEGLLSIGEESFARCDGLERIAIPDSVTDLGDRAFADLPALASVTLGTGLERVGEDVFADSAVTSLTVEAGLKTIGRGMFRRCPLTELTLPEGLVSVGEEAFSGCLSLGYVDGRLDVEKIVLPDSLVSVGVNAFDGTYFLGQTEGAVKVVSGHLLVADPEAVSGTVTLPEGTVAIADRAFYGCKNLTGVVFNGDLVSIGAQSFAGCSGLDSITAEAGDVYHAESNCLIETATNTLVLGCAQSVIPASVEHIGDCAFFGCDRLQHADLPAGLRSVGGSAFFGCSALADVTLPAGLAEIGAHAFEGCASFTKVVLPDAITALPENAFAFCEKVKDIVVPAAFTSFGENAFAGCYAVEHLYFRGTAEAWKSVLVLGEENNANLNKREILYFFASSDPADGGNYWHEEGGVPAPWGN